MSSSRLLLLIPNGSYRAQDFVIAANKFKVPVTVGSNHKPVLQKQTQNQTLYVDFSKDEYAVEQITAFNGANAIQAIIGVDETTTLIAAKASMELGLKYNPPEAISTAHNKYKMRCALRDTELAIPEFNLVKQGADTKTIANNQIYPCVLKPTNLSASRGVIRADRPKLFIEAINHIRHITKEWSASNDYSVLVESYISGPEVALEGLLENGKLRCLALFDKPGMSEGPFFEETMFVTPSCLDQRLQDECLNTIQQVVQTIGLCEGPVHAELRIHDNKPWLIELAARSIGGLCSRALRFSADTTLEEIIVRHALGLPLQGIEPSNAASGVMMIPIPSRGQLLVLNGMDKARKVSGVEDIRLGVAIGQQLLPPPDGDRYLGFIFARGDNPRFVEHALKEAHNQLDFEIAASTLDETKQRSTH